MDINMDSNNKHIDQETKTSNTYRSSKSNTNAKTPGSELTLIKDSRGPEPFRGQANPESS